MPHTTSNFNGLGGSYKMDPHKPVLVKGGMTKYYDSGGLNTNANCTFQIFIWKWCNPFYTPHEILTKCIKVSECNVTPPPPPQTTNCITWSSRHFSLVHEGYCLYLSENLLFRWGSTGNIRVHIKTFRQQCDWGPAGQEHRRDSTPTAGVCVLWPRLLLFVCLSTLPACHVAAAAGCKTGKGINLICVKPYIYLKVFNLSMFVVAPFVV